MKNGDHRAKFTGQAAKSDSKVMLQSQAARVLININKYRLKLKQTNIARMRVSGALA